MRVLGATVLATGRRLLPSLLGAAACALAWLVLGAGPAHGDALLPDPDPGLLGEVAEVAAPVEPVLDTTTEVVAEVVDQVTAPAPPAVVEPVRRVADTVRDDVDRLAPPVVEVAREVVQREVVQREVVQREVVEDAREVAPPAGDGVRTPARQARVGADVTDEPQGRDVARTARERTGATTGPRAVRVAMHEIPTSQGDSTYPPLLHGPAPTDRAHLAPGGSPAPDSPRHRPVSVSVTAVPVTSAAAASSALAVLVAGQTLPVPGETRVPAGTWNRPDTRTIAPGSRPD